MPDDRMCEVKTLLAGINSRLANDGDRTMNELVLAVNLLVGLVEGHRHSVETWHPETGWDYTGPMQAMEGRDQ